MARTNFSHNWPELKPGGYDPIKQADGYYLDPDAGQKVIDFFSACLTHVRGPMKGKPFVLEPWLAAIVGHLYGWKATGSDLRRYREALILVPRKNAKSLLGAGIGLVELFMGDPNTPEIMIGSGDREQARQMLDTIKLMIQQEPEIAGRLEVFKNIIRCPANNGWLKVVSSESYNLHGANLSCALIDETHVVKRDLVEVMQTSQGSRLSPLVVNLSTAGFDRHSILFEKRDYAIKVQDGIIDDPAFFPVIYEADPDTDWADLATWEAANPNLGKSISVEFLKRECQRALESPAFEASFKRLYLNIWTESESPWLQMARFDQCLGDLPDLSGRPAYLGLDLASQVDLCALAVCFPPQEENETFYARCFCWVPGDNIRERARRDKVPYMMWRDQGWIEPTLGSVISYEPILSKIDELARQYDVRAVLFDRWGSSMIVQSLEEKGLTVIEHGQGFKDMSPPTKELFKMIMAKTIRFEPNPALRWCFSNVVVEQDPAGNIKISKRRSIEKVDAAIATVMAADGAIRDVMQRVEPDIFCINF